MSEIFPMRPLLEKEDQNKRAIIRWANGLVPDEKINEYTNFLFNDGVNFIRSIAGHGYAFPLNYLIVIGRRRSHANAGAVMYLSESALRNALSGDSSRQIIEGSLMVHEIIHNLRDEEDLSMLAELIYVIEKHQLGRVRKILAFYEEGRLEQQYQEGLAAIADWLGFSDVRSCLSVLDETYIERMKAVFREQIHKLAN